MVGGKGCEVISGVAGALGTGSTWVGAAGEAGCGTLAEEGVGAGGGTTGMGGKTTCGT